VPEVARQVHDPAWPGTGNWSFNVAFPGSLPGLKALAIRMRDLNSLEQCWMAGVPVAASVSYARLRGRASQGDGHLVVCVGFDRSGDVVVNDPGTSVDIRRSFPRADFADAWGLSGNLAYLILPQERPLPSRLTDWVIP